MKWVRPLVLVILCFCIVSCRIKIVVPEGGRVVSSSGAYNCPSGKTCSIDVVDIFFSETFTARPASGYEFHVWKKKSNALCAGSSTPCRLSTAGFDEFPALMSVLESNDVYQLKPVFVKRSEPLRVFQDGDKISYVGEISSEDADGLLITAEITAVREYFDTENMVDDIDVMLQQLTLRLNSDGREFPEASFYFQDEEGKWVDVSDTAGNFIRDTEAGRFGVVGFPSPMVPLTKQVFQIESVSGEDLSTSIANGKLTINVSKLKNVAVPLGTFKAYKVSSKLKLELLVEEAVGAKVVVDQVHWIVPDVGAIKTEFSQRSYDSNNVYEGTFASSMEAVDVNY